MWRSHPRNRALGVGPLDRAADATRSNSKGHASLTGVVLADRLKRMPTRGADVQSAHLESMDSKSVLNLSSFHPRSEDGKKTDFPY